MHTAAEATYKNRARERARVDILLIDYGASTGACTHTHAMDTYVSKCRQPSTDIMSLPIHTGGGGGDGGGEKALLDSHHPERVPTTRLAERARAHTLESDN